MVCLLRCGDVCVVLLFVIVAAAVVVGFAMVASCYVGFLLGVRVDFLVWFV
jgi:hypothetical protein